MKDLLKGPLYMFVNKELYTPVNTIVQSNMNTNTTIIPRLLPSITTKHYCMIEETSLKNTTLQLPQKLGLPS